VNDENLARILSQARRIAVVGLSDKPWRASHGVARYLQQSGYEILPVNPNIDEALGERSFPRLEDIAESVDIIDVFRRPEFVQDLVEPALRSGAKLVWMQEGIYDAESADLLRQGGLEVIMDRCLMVEHMRLLGASSDR
jgi:predicted CoA-binding protein